MPEIAATFRKPFAEQVAAWRLRLGNLVPTSRWNDLQGRQFERGFMVAGAVKADLLEDLAIAVDRAIVDGTGFDAFKKDFRALVEKNGWHGWTGEGTARGEEWRMRTIYRTNMRTTYMAGRHAQLVDGNYKYWVYRHSGARHPRLDHKALDGIALPPDHPFWLKFYPPNGWGCGCEVEGANTRKGIIRMGGDPDKQLPDDWDAIDLRTGEPVGIGRGWGYPIGTEVRDDVLAMVSKLKEWPEALATEFLRSLPARLKSDVAAAMAEMRGFSDALLREARAT